MSYAYQPGTCNLGKAEVRSRQFVALVGAIISVTSFLGLIAADSPRGARWSLFIPLMVFSVGFIQSRKRFCLAYGFMGTFNLGRLGELSRVQSPEDRRADRKTALTILFQSALLALAITSLAVIAPV
ncbi:MAG: hypothetical protein RLZZ99_275 [Actinomycetota bacterium]